NCFLCSRHDFFSLDAGALTNSAFPKTPQRLMLNASSLHFPQLLGAFCAAMAAGAVNSVAGGGTLLTFPVLLALGLPPVVANATNTVGIWPGAIGSVLGFRKELATLHKRLLWLLVPSFVGGLIGAITLRDTPQRLFEQVVPLLVLFATLLFIAQSKLRKHQPCEESRLPTDGVRFQAALLLQFGVAIYGGYFGAGMSILALAVLGFVGMSNLLAMGATTSLLGLAINGAAGAIFIRAGLVEWPCAIAMALGSLIGGYAATGIARRIGKVALRRFVILVGCSMSTVLFVRVFGSH
ncbi:MAG: sulfite exporter TauE/SafE family protein, partial [Verrucomicrobiota bacterium]